MSFGIIFGHPLARKLFGPRLEWQNLALLQRIVDVVDEMLVRAPDTGEIHLAVRRTRRGPGRGVLSACCSSILVFPAGGGQKGQDDSCDCANRDDWAWERLAHRGPPSSVAAPPAALVLRARVLGGSAQA
jgi:hypothetical protein